MSRFIEGCDRRQRLLLPDCIDDFVSEDSPVRVVDMFVDELDLATLGFEGAAATGRPGYHPATMMKLYVYGYLNQVQSSRRLEREAGRNVEVMWLTGKLAPDFKTIADFRRDHGVAIQAACRRFVLVCRNLGLIAGGTVAVDGSRLRAANARDRNFTPVTIRRRMEQVDASIQRYLGMLDTADRQESDAAELRTARLTTRLGELQRQMRELEAMEEAVMASPDGQISLTDPDARAMASAGTGTGLVGYNLQAAVDTKSHIVVAHEVINLSHDRTSLASMGRKAAEAMAAPVLTVLADRGYFSGPEVLACKDSGIVPILPKPLTSGAKAGGRFGKQDFVYQPESDTYRCPAGEMLTKRFSSIEHGLTLHGYATPACRTRCAVRTNCTASVERRIKRWEHEEVIDAMQARLDRWPDAMRVRRRTVEHVFGTLKDWMGRSHFKTRTLTNVATEASLHILAYNIKRAIALLGVPRLMTAMQA
ncbi:IS1182 family transposase [Sphingomonas sp.]|uniref:IS1182 family transposase n=1 Tax=Sphingomonas sp. TaxID=28214 RepID=UPI0035BBF721